MAVFGSQSNINENCTVFTKDYDTAKSVISVTLCVFGVVYTFFGKWIFSLFPISKGD